MVLLKRATGIALGVLLLGAASWLAPAAPPSTLPALETYQLLGPFRPLVAELRLVQYRERMLHFEPFAQLDEALSILALRPDRVDLWAAFANEFIRDMGFREVGRAERLEWVRSGFEILRFGLDQLPAAPVLWLTRGQCLRSIVEFHPELLQALDPAPSSTEARRWILSAYERGFDLSPPDTLERDLSREHLLRWLLRELGGDEVTTEDRDRLRSVAERLLATNELRPRNAEALRSALAGSAEEGE
jgi:hypothetical protein